MAKYHFTERTCFHGAEAVELTQTYAMMKFTNLHEFETILPATTHRGCLSLSGYLRHLLYSLAEFFMNVLQHQLQSGAGFFNEALMDPDTILQLLSQSMYEYGIMFPQSSCAFHEAGRCNLMSVYTETHRMHHLLRFMLTSGQRKVSSEWINDILMCGNHIMHLELEQCASMLDEKTFAAWSRTASLSIILPRVLIGALITYADCSSQPLDSMPVWHASLCGRSPPDVEHSYVTMELVNLSSTTAASFRRPFLALLALFAEPSLLKYMSHRKAAQTTLNQAIEEEEKCAIAK